jgi:hypothetical protein
MASGGHDGSNRNDYFQGLKHVPQKACPGLDPGWIPVSRLREALA